MEQFSLIFWGMVSIAAGVLGVLTFARPDANAFTKFFYKAAGGAGPRRVSWPLTNRQGCLVGGVALMLGGGLFVGHGLGWW